jgi:hypothetical protein
VRFGVRRAALVLALCIAGHTWAPGARGDAVDVLYSIEIMSSFGGVQVQPPGDGTMKINWQATPGSQIVPGPAQVVSLSGYQFFSLVSLGSQAILTGSLWVVGLTGPGTLDAYPGNIAIGPGTVLLSGYLHCSGPSCPNYGFVNSIGIYVAYPGVPFPASFTGGLDPADAPDTVDLFDVVTIAGIPIGIQLVGQEVGHRVHDPPTPNIELPQQNLDFGQVPAGQTATIYLEVANVGNADLVVTAISSSDAVFLARMGNAIVSGGLLLLLGGALRRHRPRRRWRTPGLLLATLLAALMLSQSGEAARRRSVLVASPGQSALVPVEFTPAAPVAYDETLTITSNDPDESPVTVVLTGQGI